MPIIQGTWRVSRLTKFGSLEKSIRADAAMRAQQKAEGLRVLRAMLPVSEYDAMLSQCESGEREVRLENGFVLTCFSPK